MAITLDGSIVTAETDSTVSFTVGDNANRILLVSIGTHQSNKASGVTYNGDSLTLIKRQEGSYGEHCEIWGMLAPDIGTADVVVSGANNYWAMGIYSFYGVNQSALPDIFNGANAESSSATTSVTTEVDNSVVVGVVSAEPVPTLNTSGGTADWSQQGVSYQNAAGARVTKATAGVQAMTYSLSYGGRWQIVAVALEPSTGSFSSSLSTSGSPSLSSSTSPSGSLSSSLSSSVSSSLSSSFSSSLSTSASSSFSQSISSSVSSSESLSRSPSLSSSSSSSLSPSRSSSTSLSQSPSVSTSLSSSASSSASPSMGAIHPISWVQDTMKPQSYVVGIRQKTHVVTIKPISRVL